MEQQQGLDLNCHPTTVTLSLEIHKHPPERYLGIHLYEANGPVPSAKRAGADIDAIVVVCSV